MPEISIIVPVYKVEKYLKKCVDSILAQTFTDFELILVDDGSPDNCGEICDEYAKKDPRIRVLHKKNGGLSDARNAGIDISKGKFLGFVDSDDFVAPDMYETLHRDITSCGADVACCGMFAVFKNRIEPSQTPLVTPKILTGDEPFIEILADRIVVPSACNKLYRRTLFKNLRFPVSKLFEDAFLIPKIFVKSEKVYLNPAPKYFYVHRSHSIMTSPFKPADFAVVDAYKEHYETAKKHYPRALSAAKFRLLWAHVYLLEKIAISHNPKEPEVEKRIMKFLRRNAKEFIKNKHFTKNRKLMNILLLMSPHLFKIVTKKYRAKRNPVI